MIINRKPLSSYFLQSQNQPMEGGFVHQKQMQYQLQQQTLSEQFNNYPQNKMQAWQELNHKITKQINIMLKKKISEQRDNAQTQKQEEKKQLDEIYGKDKTKVNYLVFSTAKRRSVSTDDLKLSQIYNKFQYNLSQAPKKSILKLESSYKQRNNYTHTENDDSSSSPILLRHIEERRTVDPETNKEDNQRSIQSYILQTPEIHKQHSDQFSNSSTSSSSHMNESRQRYLSYDRPSSCSEIKQKKRVQFSDTIRKLRVKYEDQSGENNHSHHHNLHAKSQVIFANKVTPFIVPTQQQHITQLISQHQQQQLQQQQQQQQQQQSQIQQPLQQQMNQSQQQLSQSQLSQQSKDFQPQQSLSDFKPYTIQTYRTALSTKLFQQHKPQLNNSQKVNQDDQSGKILLRDKLQIMNSNFRDRLQKKLNQALEKKEELKKLQQIIQQPLQITNIQPKQVQSYPTVQYLIKLPSRKQLSQIQS